MNKPIAPPIATNYLDEAFMSYIIGDAHPLTQKRNHAKELARVCKMKYLQRVRKRALLKEIRRAYKKIMGGAPEKEKAYMR